MMVCDYHNRSEMFENYLLDRLSQTEKDDFESHLKSCQECRQQLEKEKWLLASLREIGKREMKDEIQKQVKLKRTEKNLTDWGMILKVAAVILFVVITPGLIYYYQYMTPQLEQYATDKRITSEVDEFTAPKVVPEEKGSPGEQQIVADKDEANKMRMEAPEGELTPTLQREMRDAPLTEEIPLGGDLKAVGTEPANGKTREDLQKKKEKPSQTFTTDELETRAGRSRPITAMPHDDTVFRYDAEAQSEELIDEKTTFFRSKELSKSEVNQKTWHFRKESQAITMQLQLLDTSLRREEQFPEKIPTQVIMQDSIRIAIECQVTSDIFKLDPSEVTLYLSDPRTLQIQLPAKVTYQIDLNQKSQDAIQLKR